jgi:hypothetical protein
MQLSMAVKPLSESSHGHGSLTSAPPYLSFFLPYTVPFLGNILTQGQASLHLDCICVLGSRHAGIASRP